MAVWWKSWLLSSSLRLLTTTSGGWCGNRIPVIVLLCHPEIWRRICIKGRQPVLQLLLNTDVNTLKNFSRSRKKKIISIQILCEFPEPKKQEMRHCENTYAPHWTFPQKIQPGILSPSANFLDVSSEFKRSRVITLFIKFIRFPEVLRNAPNSKQGAEQHLCAYSN